MIQPFAWIGRLSLLSTAEKNICRSRFLARLPTYSTLTRVFPNFRSNNFALPRRSGQLAPMLPDRQHRSPSRDHCRCSGFHHSHQVSPPERNAKPEPAGAQQKHEHDKLHPPVNAHVAHRRHHACSFSCLYEGKPRCQDRSTPRPREDNGWRVRFCFDLFHCSGMIQPLVWMRCRWWSSTERKTPAGHRAMALDWLKGYGLWRGTVAHQVLPVRHSITCRIGGLPGNGSRGCDERGHGSARASRTIVQER